jgi:two-component system, NarL family, sensor kinase
MPTRWVTSAALAWVAAALTVVLVAASLMVAALGREGYVYPAAAALASACLGCVLLARRPGHPMGPLLCYIGLATAVPEIAFVYAHYALRHPADPLPFARPALWAVTWDNGPAISLAGLVLPLVFPDGRLLSRRWRPALWAALAVIPLWVLGQAFTPQPMGSYLYNLPNPYVAPSLLPLFDALQGLAAACAAVAGVAAIASLTLRWRQADRTGRQQLKWFLAVLPIAAGAIIAQDVDPGGLVNVWFGAIGGVLLPTAIGIAVLRYKLYEIDILLNRALVYGLLTAGVAGVYLGIVALGRAYFGMNPSLRTEVVATVLAVAVLFPLQGRVQRRIDRLFYGDRGAPYEALARLGRRVEEAADTESALNTMVKTIADSLRLPYAAIELRLGDEWRPTAAYGEAPVEVVAFPLIFQRETVGRLLVGTRGHGDRLGPEEERLLADLARQAGPATHAVALRQALDASRAGLVTAREEERRRLRRDLHDGIGPTLAGLTLGLDTARRRLSPDQTALLDLLDKLKAETQRAVADVRRIVYGLRPPALDQLGLAGSLREEVGRLKSEAPELTVTLDASDDALADLPAAAEVACYRIVTEALTNVIRHAKATRCWVRIRFDGCLDVEVRDDGVGLPEGWRTGVGIASMRERVTELGGDLVIEPSLPHGTRIAARLPAKEQP